MLINHGLFSISTFISPALSSNSAAESLIFKNSVPDCSGVIIVPKPTVIG